MRNSCEQNIKLGHAVYKTHITQWQNDIFMRISKLELFHGKIEICAKASSGDIKLCSRRHNHRAEVFCVSKEVVAPHPKLDRSSVLLGPNSVNFQVNYTAGTFVLNQRTKKQVTLDDNLRSGTISGEIFFAMPGHCFFIINRS